MYEYGSSKSDLNWLLDDVVNRVVGAQNAIVLSADGLLIGRSAGMSEEDGWYDEAAGPLVRPYTITSGRTPADSERLDLSTQVMTSLRAEQEPTGLGPEHLAIVRLCRQSMSIAEIAAYVKIPLGVV